MRFKIILLVAASTTVLATAGSTLAQTPVSHEIEEVVVNAQKREQRLQDVPIVVTALSERVLADAGVRDIKDLTILTAGLSVSSNSNETATTARIRGIGTLGENPGLESSVGVVIDGVYRPRNGVALTDLGEIKQVEVLKGPQGTLFGVNTSAGVINVMTTSPSFERRGRLEFTAGDYGARGVSASYNGTLVENSLAGSIFVARRVREGLNSTRVGGGPRSLREDQNQDYGTVRGQLLFLPTSEINLRLIADYTKRDEDCCAGVQVAVGPTGALVDALAPDEGLMRPSRPYDRVTYSNRGTRQKITDKGFSAELNATTPLGELTSITAWRDWTNDVGWDVDFSTADILWRDDKGGYGSGFETFSQELRLAGDNGGLHWLLGGIYIDEALNRRDEILYGSGYEAYASLLLSGGSNPALVSQLTGLAPGQSFPVNEGYNDVYRQDSKVLAFFTHNTYDLSQKLALTVGARYTQQEKDLEILQKNSAGNVGCGAALQRMAAGAIIPPPLLGLLCIAWANPAFANRQAQQSLSEDAVTGTVNLAYRWTDEVMTYGSYARGFKSGGFNLERQTTGLTPDLSTAFRPETVDSYELGLKSRLFDRTLVLNTTAFWQRYEDFQLSNFTGTGFVVRSAPEIISQGVDVDMTWSSPVPGLKFQGGVTYAKTDFGDEAVPGLPKLRNVQVPFAPRWSTSVASSYERDLGNNIDLRISLTAKYSSSYNTGVDLSPVKEQESFWLANVRAVVAKKDSWAVEIWSQNLFDQNYTQVKYDVPVQGGTVNAWLGAPRTSGVTLRYNF